MILNIVLIIKKGFDSSASRCKTINIDAGISTLTDVLITAVRGDHVEVGDPHNDDMMAVHEEIIRAIVYLND
jgi:hypothetical protein